MNGAHDCGGMMGFGPVVAEMNEPVFHAPWEARMFALMSAVGDVGGWTLDEDRASCESMHPGHYINSSYYEHWLNGLEILLGKYGVAKSVTPTPAGAVWQAITTPGSYRREVSSKPRFKPGDMVRTRHMNPATHTRLPRYLRGHMAQVVAWHGAHVFPDSNAQGLGEDPRHLYTLRFRAAEVWGKDTRDTIHADLWEPYLEAC